jgi:hypothetical protein
MLTDSMVTNEAKVITVFSMIINLERKVVHNGNTIAVRKPAMVVEDIDQENLLSSLSNTSYKSMIQESADRKQSGKKDCCNENADPNTPKVSYNPCGKGFR